MQACPAPDTWLRQADVTLQSMGMKRVARGGGREHEAGDGAEDGRLDLLHPAQA